jgi:glycerol-3-phosphate dehydrogenase (NAD(P)+)
VLTATGALSRNRTLGFKLGRGYKLEDILGQTKTVAEGMNTAKAVHLLSQRLGVEMPICEQVYALLYQGVPPKEALSALMNRDLKEELEF